MILAYLGVSISVLLSGVWAYSYVYGDTWGFRGSLNWYYIRISKGKIRITQIAPAELSLKYQRRGHYYIWNIPAANESFSDAIRVAGFEYRRERKREEVIHYDVTGHLALSPQFTISIAVPFWFPVLLGALPLYAIIRQRVFARRLAEGICKKCGYDLRASPLRCPECGLAVITAVSET